MSGSVGFNSEKAVFHDFSPKSLIAAGKMAAKAGKIGAFLLLNTALAGIPTMLMLGPTAKNSKALYRASVDGNESPVQVAVSMVKTAKAQAKFDQAINEEPECRHDPEKMIHYLCSRHGAAAVRSMLNSLTDGDFRFNGQDARFQFDRQKLDEALSQYPDSNAQSNITASRLIADEAGEEIPSMTYSDSVKKDITDELVVFINRRPITVGTTAGEIVQRYGHMEHQQGAAVFKEGGTPSAELPNGKKIDNVVNQASITFEGKDGVNKVVMCRSGRTDSAKKIRDKSLGDIASRLDASGKKGDSCLVKVGSHYEYRRVDNTLMDSSSLKSAYTVVTGFFKNLGTEKPLESERMFITDKKKAIQEVWNPKNQNVKFDESKKLPYIEHHINHGGETVTVREYPPVVNEYVFSGQAGSVSNLEAARKANRGTTLEMGRMLAQGALNFPDLEKKFEACQANPNSSSKLKELTDAIKDEHPADPHLEIALDGIYASLTGVDRKSGESIDTVEGAAMQYLYASMLAEVVGMAFGAECKSGNDRTCTAMALKCAQEEFSQVAGRPFDPRSQGEDLAQFKQLFVKYVIALGEPNVAASRGLKKGSETPVLKADKHPIFNYLARESSVNDKGEKSWIKVNMPGFDAPVSVADVVTLV